MNKTRRMISVLLAVVIAAMSVLPLSAFAMVDINSTKYDTKFTETIHDVLYEMRGDIAFNLHPDVWQTINDSLLIDNGYFVSMYKLYGSSKYCIFVTNNFRYKVGNDLIGMTITADANATAATTNTVVTIQHITSSGNKVMSSYSTRFDMFFTFDLNDTSASNISSDYYKYAEATSAAYSDYRFTAGNLCYSNADFLYTNSTKLYSNFTYFGYAEKTYTVTFVDGVDDSVINVSQVKHGEAATAPEPPEHKNYYFSEWDSDFSYVTSDMTVTANYIYDTGWRHYKFVCVLDNTVIQQGDVIKGGSFLELLQKHTVIDENSPYYYVIPYTLHDHYYDRSVAEHYYYRGLSLYKFDNDHQTYKIRKDFVDFEITSDITIYVYYAIANDDTPDVDYDPLDGEDDVPTAILKGLGSVLTSVFKSIFIPSDSYLSWRIDSTLAKIEKKADITSYKKLLESIKDVDKSNTAPDIDFDTGFMNEIAGKNFQKQTSTKALDLSFYEKYRYIVDAVIYAVCYAGILLISIVFIKLMFNT